jgi:hypothetical protein
MLKWMCFNNEKGDVTKKNAPQKAPYHYNIVS